MNYGLIGCVGLKLPHKAKAKELYLSDLFKKSLAYCLKNYEKNFILSALYGVVDLEEEIEPYDLTLNTMPKQLIYVWSEKVFGQLNKILKDGDNVYFHCGENYSKFLMYMLMRVGVNCHFPLKSLQIGKRKQFYVRNK